MINIPIAELVFEKVGQDRDGGYWGYCVVEHPLGGWVLMIQEPEGEIAFIKELFETEGEAKAVGIVELMKQVV